MIGESFKIVDRDLIQPLKFQSAPEMEAFTRFREEVDARIREAFYGGRRAPEPTTLTIESLPAKFFEPMKPLPLLWPIPWNSIINHIGVV
jgi:hypothetical protein